MADVLEEELSENGLLAADRRQRRILAEGNEQGFAQALHPNFIINAPHNICGGREQVLRLSQGAFAQESSHPQIEKVSLTGNVGILMGSERVTPAAGSLMATWFGTAPIRRRFTNVYLFEEGKWLLLARQASVIREANKFGA